MPPNTVVRHYTYHDRYGLSLSRERVTSASACLFSPPGMLVSPSYQARYWRGAAGVILPRLHYHAVICLLLGGSLRRRYGIVVTHAATYYTTESRAIHRIHGEVSLSVINNTIVVWLETRQRTSRSCRFEYALTATYLLASTLMRQELLIRRRH